MNATVTRIAADPGLYLHDGGVYRVRQSTTSPGRYAEGLIVEGNAFLTGRWEFVPGLVTTLKDAPRLTVTEAVRLGRVLGVCVACGRRLSGVSTGIHALCKRMMTEGEGQ